MKKTLDLIKDYIVFGLILSIIVSLFIPISASAADDPTEAEQAVIPAGTYSFKLDLAPLLIDGAYPQEFIDMRYTVSSVVVDGVSVSSNNIFEIFFVGWKEQDGVTSQSFYYMNDDNGRIGVNIGNDFNNFAGFNCYVSEDAWFSLFINADSSIIGPIPSFGRTITVLEDASVPSYFAEWFLTNTNLGDPVDPGPTVYTISAGYYKARDSWYTSGFPASNDSIRIRYYNDATNVQAYEEAEGIIFHVVSDIVEILYGDASVFVDGWNIDGAKYIQVLQDISVDSGFYTVFNNIFETSSQGTNDFKSGYAAGYVDGYNEGRDEGYTQGYYEGMAESSGNFFTDIIDGVLGALDSFTIFGGFSLLDLLTTLLGGMALIWILKLLAGG